MLIGVALRATLRTPALVARTAVTMSVPTAKMPSAPSRILSQYPRMEPA
jgi:hypothetical protein